MAEIRIFEPPATENDIFVVKGITYEATDINYIARFYTPGEFSFVIPAKAKYANEFIEERIVWINKEFWGIIRGVKYTLKSNENIITVTGECLKGLMYDRITLPYTFNQPSGLSAYVAMQGPTETIMKDLVSQNFITSENPNRNIPRFICAEDQQRGIAEDKYMTRFEPLADAIGKLGEAAKLGSIIYVDLDEHKFVFDCVVGTDRSGSQSDRPRMIFDADYSNILSQNYERNRSTAKNIFYATMSGAEFEDEALTQMYYRDGEDEASGLHRKEMQLNISADSPTPGEEYDELKRYALIEAEQYRPIETFDCEVQVYNRDYFLGDIVTIRSKEWNITMDTQITEMATTLSANNTRRVVTFGTSKPNIFTILKRQIKNR